TREELEQHRTGARRPSTGLISSRNVRVCELAVMLLTDRQRASDHEKLVVDVQRSARNGESGRILHEQTACTVIGGLVQHFDFDAWTHRLQAVAAPGQKL